MPAHVKAITAVLVVDEIGPTRTFFCDRLGFAVVGNAAAGAADQRLLIARDEVELSIESAADLRMEGGENGDPGPYRAVVSIEVDNVELLIPEVVDTDIVWPLRKNARTGMHEIGVREPGGNIIKFGSRLAP